MTSGIIDESAIAEALRLGEPCEAIKRLLRFQGLGVWHGDLSEMRRDVPRRRSTEADPPSPEARKVIERMAMVRAIREALPQLPSESQEALRLYLHEGLPIADVAKRLGVRFSDAASLMFKTMARLRELVESGKHDDS